ncbi:MAG: amino acid ABC transporter substrate-binding protein [Micrococcales bacterium]|nr:amino acid ABC transporter substrate-binding protein [Micrococcales bacterium]NBS60703.1 amino acid ABC transporter substrate-binding protein [Microbacteriaceae bacterium]NBX95115.1 amino acid ABC transporter substrate-binding protein [Actinomycetota bacterium]NBS85679.1 amino acid ABC transporter substrate-binding protein [Micrococcales bacterium]NDC19826.1 amino acid ABC transporter substrate-binding protein [Microbacteriaceae bacterium]
MATSRKTIWRTLAATAAVLVATTLSACSSGSVAGDTITEGKLTIGTGNPAYSPWVLNDAPESGEGFEAAVAYAVAEKLGFAKEDVVWVRTTFDEAIAPGQKNFDFNLQQYSITEERKANVDFSSPYYETAQVVVTTEGSAAAGATSIADLQGYLIGAATGTTSFDAIGSVIAPTQDALAFNSNDDAKAALTNGQVDAIVLDLPTALYASCCELDGGKIIGQLPTAAKGDQFGLVLDKGSKLTAAVTKALDDLRADGTLAALEEKWLTADAGVPVLN